jgi:hypothetical protein
MRIRSSFNPSGIPLVKTAVAAFCALAAFVFISSACAAQADSALTASQLTAILKSGDKKLNSVSTVTRVLGTGPNVTVMVQCPPTASERDLKIDATLFAKKLIETPINNIDKVELIFSSGAAGDGKIISIDKQLIQNYGGGSMTVEQLLSSLNFSPVIPDDLPGVEQGPQMERRLIILERIEKLRKTGTGVKPFQSIFASIESAIKSGDCANLSGRLSELESSLTEQEEQVAIAKRTASGQGVSVIKSKSWAPSYSAGVTPQKSVNALRRAQEDAERRRKDERPGRDFQQRIRSNSGGGGMLNQKGNQQNQVEFSRLNKFARKVE